MPLPYILLIDDDEDDRIMLSGELLQKGIVTKDFNSGEKAFTYLTGMAPDVDQPSMIILDYNMPRLNGQQILSVIKNNSSTKNIPVVLYSTTISPILRSALLELGAVDCFIKPNSDTELAERINTFKTMFFSLTEGKEA